MSKANHPSGGVGSSNPRRLRGWRLHHHGDGVCWVFVLCVSVLSSYVDSTREILYVYMFCVYADIDLEILSSMSA
jgi:hypothetical protein